MLLSENTRTVVNQITRMDEKDGSMGTKMISSLKERKEINKEGSEIARCAFECDVGDRISPEMVSEKRAFPEISRKWKIIRVWKICPILPQSTILECKTN